MKTISVLVAYVVAKDKNKSDEAGWHQHAVHALPWYMVPASFMVVESFLLTPNGKVDRKALPAFHFSRPVDAEAGPEMQEDCLELAVLHCWRTVLNRRTSGWIMTFSKPAVIRCRRCGFSLN